MTKLETAYARIDAVNGEDPNVIEIEGKPRPAELVYGERMTVALARTYPEASEAVKLAARAQHIRRWTVPRALYPMDRPGYLRWRNELKRKHADWAGAILAECGYQASEIARVAALIRKENLRTDAESQALEDIAAIVFFEHYAGDFAGKHDAAKVIGIVKKTLAKMSERGRQAAMALDLAPAVRALLVEASALRIAAEEGAP